MSKINVKYSQDNENWFDFSKGVEIDDEEINNWVKDCYKTMKKDIKSGKKKTNYFIASGNTIVWGTIYQINRNSNNYEILIRVAKNYSELCKTVKIVS